MLKCFFQINKTLQSQKEEGLKNKLKLLQEDYVNLENELRNEKEKSEKLEVKNQEQNDNLSINSDMENICKKLKESYFCSLPKPLS